MYCVTSTSCRGHWLQLATMISLPYSLVRRQHFDQEQFPAKDTIQGYLLGVYTCVTVYLTHHFTAFLLSILTSHCTCMYAAMVCVCQKIKETTYLLTALCMLVLSWRTTTIKYGCTMPNCENNNEESQPVVVVVVVGVVVVVVVVAVTDQANDQ